MRGESNISRRRERTVFMLCSHYHILRLFFFDEMYAFRASFFPFFLLNIPTVCSSDYISGRTCVYLHSFIHSFFMITTICSHLHREKVVVFVFLFAHADSDNCRYIFFVQKQHCLKGKSRNIDDCVCVCVEGDWRYKEKISFSTYTVFLLLFKLVSVAE